MSRPEPTPAGQVDAQLYTVICAQDTADAEQTIQKAGLDRERVVYATSLESIQGLYLYEIYVIETALFVDRPDAEYIRQQLRIRSVVQTPHPKWEAMTPYELPPDAVFVTLPAPISLSSLTQRILRFSHALKRENTDPASHRAALLITRDEAHLLAEADRAAQADRAFRAAFIYHGIDVSRGADMEIVEVRPTPNPVPGMVWGSMYGVTLIVEDEVKAPPPGAYDDIRRRLDAVQGLDWGVTYEDRDECYGDWAVIGPVKLEITKPEEYRNQKLRAVAVKDRQREDAVIDFVSHAAADMQRLLTGRRQAQPEPPPAPPSRVPLTVICAYDTREAELVLRERGMHVRDAVYARDVDVLRGMSDVWVIETPGFHRRPDARHIQEYLRQAAGIRRLTDHTPGTKRSTT